MKALPKCPKETAHPQSVWFEEHWKPIFESLEDDSNTYRREWESALEREGYKNEIIEALANENRRLREALEQVVNGVKYYETKRDAFFQQDWYEDMLRDGESYKLQVQAAEVVAAPAKRALSGDKKDE